jgi:hypothetical protein
MLTPITEVLKADIDPEHNSQSNQSANNQRLALSKHAPERP